MTRIQVGSELMYEVRQTTVFLFNIAAGWTLHQRVDNETLNFDPHLNVEYYQIGVEGNRFQRVVVEPCLLRLSYRADVELSPMTQYPNSIDEAVISRTPADVLPYLNPSRYCESDLLARFSYEEFGQLPPGFNRVQTICEWVNDHLDYTPLSTTATTTAADVLLQRTGVCRDYAHLAIALLRGVGIPARYVSGYAVDLQPPDFHGFIEAYLDGGWYLFDPTKLVPITSLVRIGTGRDAADVAFATLTGDALLQEKSVWANFLVGPANTEAAGGQSAVSIA